MTWRFTYQPRFLADLKGLDPPVAERIVAKLEAIREDPLRSMKRLKGSNLFSLRIGDHRLFAHVQAGARWVDFIRAAHRSVGYDE